MNEVSKSVTTCKLIPSEGSNLKVLIYIYLVTGRYKSFLIRNEQFQDLS